MRPGAAPNGTGPPFAEAVRHEVLTTSAFDDYTGVIVVVIPPDTEIDAAIVATKAANTVPDDTYGGLWHIGPDHQGRHGVSFHLIEHGRGDLGLERIWAIYEPPRSLLDAISTLPHLVAILPEARSGPADQPAIDLRLELMNALIVAVDDHSATMQLHLRAQAGEYTAGATGASPRPRQPRQSN